MMALLMHAIRSYSGINYNYIWMDTSPRAKSFGEPAATMISKYASLKVPASVIAIPCSYFCVLNYSYNAHVIAYNVYTTFILLQSITIDDIF